MFEAVLITVVILVLKSKVMNQPDIYVNLHLDSDWLSAHVQYVCRAGVCCVFAEERICYIAAWSY